MITIGILSGDTPNKSTDLIQESLIKICPKCGKPDQWDRVQARDNGILVCKNQLEDGSICGTSLDFCRLRKEDIISSPPDILITNPDEINFALQSPRYLWKMISQRPDLLFLIPTKRIHRFLDCIPADWCYGYKNVIIAVSTENQTQADNRLPILLELPIVHKEVFVSPILEYVNLTQYLSAGKIELVSVGGESYSGARICDFDWVQRIKSDCDRFHTPFTFHQTGSLFKLGSRIYNIPHNKEYSQAVKARKILDKVQRQE